MLITLMIPLVIAALMLGIARTFLVRRHVDAVERALRDGINVRGYFYWTLIDNYEWLQGLDARFGLYRVDFDTMKRTPTSAAAYYSYLIQSRSRL